MDDLWQAIKTQFDAFTQFWNFSIFTVSKDPVTLGELINGLILLFIFYLGSKKLSNFLAIHLFSKMRWGRSTQAIVQKIVFYFFIALSVLFVMSFLNIPMTIFTVIGGALAIGVGFGSQNIVNNFMSGIILMMEQPIRIGDLVELDGLYGVIEDIGPRSTRVKSANNTHIIVPNSSFLEKNVLNWTLSDSVVRSTVRVGVAYGSKIRKAEELLLKIAANTDSVLKSPEPNVIFEDFGESTLVFDMYFHAKIKSVIELKKIASHIRFEIDDEFKKAGICIAFPQRDVHLDQLKPLQIELLNKNTP